ncbi:MAG TPA: terminase small subunit [Nitrospiraceae bacterium]|jgi:phage terminase small subunit|nr:terminase small subunit [Nitrospiraceae bacterium]
MAIRKNGELTPKERLFVAEYLKYFNATKAASEAGYSKKSARAIGAENLTKPHIIEALAKSRQSLEKREEDALLDAHRTERLLDICMTFNPKDYFDKDGNFKPIQDLTADQAYAISEIARIETELGTQIKLKFVDRLEAIGKKMKRLGMMKDMSETTVHSGFPANYEEWRKRLGYDDDGVSS